MQIFTVTRRTAPRLALAAGIGLFIAWPVMVAAEPRNADPNGLVTVTPRRVAEPILDADRSMSDAMEATAADGKMHGEATAMVDSRGGYGVAGTVAIPLGENGVAVLSFEEGRWPRGLWGIR